MKPADAPPSVPAIYSTLSGEAIGRLVEATYPIARVESCRLIDRGLNDVYELASAGGRRYIVRVSPRLGRGAPNIACELGLLVHLRRSGANVVSVVPANDGGLQLELSAAEGLRVMTVFEFLQGAPAGDELGDIALMGEGLARIHLAAQDYRGSSSLYKLDLDHLLHRPLALILRLTTLDDAMREQFTRIAAELTRRVSSFDDLSIVACHGDCHGGNTFIHESTDGRVASFFDFDDGAPGYLSYELSVFLWSHMIRAEAIEPNDVARERWRHYVDGYQRVTQIPQADFDAIACFVSVRTFWLIGEHATRADEWGTQDLSTRWLRRQIGLLSAWQTLVTPR